MNKRPANHRYINLFGWKPYVPQPPMSAARFDGDVRVIADMATAESNRHGQYLGGYLAWRDLDETISQILFSRKQTGE